MARFLFFVPFFLASCTMSATDTAIKATKDSVITLKESLSPACKTNAITSQINAITSQIESISSTCKVEVSKITAEKRTWQISCFGLIFLIVLCLFRKIKL